MNITAHRWELLNAACTRKECRTYPMSFPVLIEILPLFTADDDEQAIKIRDTADFLGMRAHTFRNALKALEQAGILVLVRKVSRQVRVYRLGRTRSETRDVAREGPHLPPDALPDSNRAA